MFSKALVVCILLSFLLPGISLTGSLGTERTTAQTSQSLTEQNEQGTYLSLPLSDEDGQDCLPDQDATSSGETVTSPTRFGMGLIAEDPTKSTVFQESPIGVPDVVSLFREASPHPGDPPSSVFNIEGLPPVGNQGSQGSCTGWASGYYCLTHQVSKANGYWDVTGTNRQFSPAFVYNHINSGEDSGSYFSDALDLLSTIGCTTLAEMPYNEADLVAWPGSQAYALAANYRVNNSYYIYTRTDAGLLLIKAYLAAGNTAFTGISVRTPFYYFDSVNNVYTTAHASEPYEGGHAVCIVGYDDTKSTTDGLGAFYLVNSWGTGWGDGGFWWMSYEAMKNTALSQGYCYYFSLMKQPYSPQLTASVRISHECRGQIMRNGIQIGLGDPMWPDWSESFFAFFMESDDGNYQNHPFPGKEIIFDISEVIPLLSTTYSNQFFVSTSDSVWPLSGVLERFSVRYTEWSIEVTSDDTPITVLDHGAAVTAALEIRCPSVTIDTTGYVGGIVNITGDAVGSSSVTVFDVGFESGSTGRVWTAFDTNPSGGYYSWAIDSWHSKSGGSSLWCGGAPSTTAIYSEYFDMPIWYWPSGWSLYSSGSNTSPWTPIGTFGGYQIYCSTGGKSNVVEWAIQGPLDTSSATELYLSFFMDYEAVNAYPGQKAHVLYSTDGSTFYFVKTWTPPVGETVEFSGEQVIPFPDSAISSSFYLAFIFEGDYTGSWTIDNIDLWNVGSEYYNYMDAYVCRPVDLAQYDSAKMVFDCLVDVEAGYDWFSPVYHASGGWYIPYQIGTTGGWVTYELEVFSGADYVGFYFHSDVSIVAHGVYVDNVRLIGVNNPSSVTLEIDGIPLGVASGVGSWYCPWDTLPEADGQHTIGASALFRDTVLSGISLATVDNSEPLLTSATSTYQHGKTISLIFYANTLGGSPLMLLAFVDATYDAWFGNRTAMPLNLTTILCQCYNSTYVPDGIYNIELKLTDMLKHNDTIVILLVVDNEAPVGNHPSDGYYPEGATGATIEWDYSDISPGTYHLYRNSSLISDGTWSDGLLHSIGVLPAGVYNFTVVFYDLAGHWSTDTVLVFIFDDTHPTVDHPADVTFSEGTTGHQLVWTAADLHPDFFTIFMNGTLYVCAAWESHITLLLDCLPMGTYNLTILVCDSSGNGAYDTVFVTVVDTTPPLLTHPNDLSYIEGTPGHILTWIATDLHPESFEVFRTGGLVSSGSWNLHTMDIAVSIDGLDSGVYNMVVVVRDRGGNTASDTVIVTVTEASTTTETTTTTTISDNLGTMMILALIGGLAGVIIVVVLLVTLKKRRG